MEQRYPRQELELLVQVQPELLVVLQQVQLEQQLQKVQELAQLELPLKRV